METFFPCEFFNIAEEKTQNKKYQQQVFTSESVTLEELKKILIPKLKQYLGFAEEAQVHGAKEFWRGKAASIEDLLKILGE